MTILVPLVLVGWVPAVLGLFVLLPSRRAVLVAFIVAWLFLPIAGYKLPGLPDYTKMSATCLGVMLGVCIFDFKRLTTFRFGWLDVPMAVWCLCPLVSSLSNNLGFYDGLSGILKQTTQWGTPYFIGRLYFSDLTGARELAVAIFLGGLVYIPFCLYEVRMSPQLHRMVYGYHQQSFAQAIRWGGYRPVVFMQHGLMVALWMTSASLSGVWLWFSGSVKRMWTLPMAVLVPSLLSTTVLCKSTGALAWLIIGIVLLFTAYLLNWRVLLFLLTLLPPAYVAARVCGWQATQLTDIAAELSAERATSLQGRLDMEKLLLAKAVQRPVFGWGGWGRNRVYNAEGRDISVTDSFWIIQLGCFGFVGLLAYFAVMVVPVIMMGIRLPPDSWASEIVAPVAILIVILVVYMIDNLFNAMGSPLYIVFAGGMTGLCIRWESLASRFLFPPELKRIGEGKNRRNQHEMSPLRGL